MASSDTRSMRRSMEHTTPIPKTTPMKCTLLPPQVGKPVRIITSHKGKVGTVEIETSSCEDGLSSAWKTYGVHESDEEEEMDGEGEEGDEVDEEGETDVGLRLNGTDTVDNEYYRSHLGNKGRVSKRGRRNRTPGPAYWTETVRPAKASPLFTRLTQTLETDLNGRDGGRLAYWTETVRPVEASPFFQRLTHTLVNDLGGREQHRSTARPAADDTKDEVYVMLPPPASTFKTLVDEEKLLNSNPERGTESLEISSPHVHDGVELDRTVAWVDRIIVRQKIKYDHDMVILPNPTTVGASSRVATIASFRTLAYPEAGVPYAYEVTEQLTPTPTSGTFVPSVSSSAYWSRFNLSVPNPLTEFSMPEVSTAAVGQSVPTPTATPIKNQKSKFTKSELRKRDILDQVELIEANPSEASKTNSAIQDISIPSTNPTPIQLENQTGPKPELRKLGVAGRIVHVIVNPNDGSHIMATVQESSTPRISPATTQLKQQVEPKSELRRRDWDDYNEWLDHVEMDRDKYLFNERQTIREAYPLQRPGGRTLKGARLEDNSPLRWVLERKKAGTAIPDEFNCRLDDMTKAPGPRSSLCDPPVHSTRPQISSASTVIPIINSFTIFISILIVWLLLLPWLRSRDPMAAIIVPPPGSTSDSDIDDGDDHDDDYPYPDDDQSPDTEAQVGVWSAVHPRYEWRGIEEHLRRSGVPIPNYDGCFTDDQEYWEGGDDWL